MGVLNNMWGIYIVSVILAWLAGRYLTIRQVGRWDSLVVLIVPFIPVVNFMPIVMVIVDIMIEKPTIKGDIVRKFYAVPNPEKTEEVE